MFTALAYVVMLALALLVKTRLISYNNEVHTIEIMNPLSCVRKAWLDLQRGYSTQCGLDSTLFHFTVRFVIFISLGRNVLPITISKGIT